MHVWNKGPQSSSVFKRDETSYDLRGLDHSQWIRKKTPLLVPFVIWSRETEARPCRNNWERRFPKKSTPAMKGEHQEMQFWHNTISHRRYCISLKAQIIFSTVKRVEFLTRFEKHIWTCPESITYIFYNFLLFLLLLLLL